ncbi:MAG: YdeI/OmpD-associated family protein [Planctomycetota bacterium]
MGRKDPRVDAYVERSAAFARPILKRLRKVVRAACPEVEETLKWSSPTFMYKGMLCGMAAFKAHCVFGFWKDALLRDGAPANAGGAVLDALGRIAAVSDLPADADLARLVKRAAALNDDGVKLPRPKRKGARKLDVPDYFLRALRANRKALATFDAFSPSHKREYVDWVTEAKGEETRARRLATAVEWMAEGKPRNWKYVKKR